MLHSTYAITRQCRSTCGYTCNPGVRASLVESSYVDQFLGERTCRHLAQNSSKGYDLPLQSHGRTLDWVRGLIVKCLGY